MHVRPCFVLIEGICLYLAKASVRLEIDSRQYRLAWKLSTARAQPGFHPASIAFVQTLEQQHNRRW